MPFRLRYPFHVDGTLLSITNSSSFRLRYQGQTKTLRTIPCRALVQLVITTHDKRKVKRNLLAGCNLSLAECLDKANIDRENCKSLEFRSPLWPKVRFIPTSLGNWWSPDWVD